MRADERVPLYVLLPAVGLCKDEREACQLISQGKVQVGGTLAPDLTGGVGIGALDVWVDGCGYARIEVVGP